MHLVDDNRDELGAFGLGQLEDFAAERQADAVHTGLDDEVNFSAQTVLVDALLVVEWRHQDRENTAHAALVGAHRLTTRHGRLPVGRQTAGFDEVPHDVVAETGQSG
jgi:hypothetical protein